jgi:hypothetical protein
VYVTDCDWNGLEWTHSGHVAPTTPFQATLCVDIVPTQRRGKIGITFFTVNITQLISDLPLKTTVLEFKFRRYSTLY